MSDELILYVKEIDLEFTIQDLNTGRVIAVDIPKASMFLSFCWNEHGKLVIHYLSPVGVPEVQHRFMVLGKQLCVPTEKMQVKHVASCGANFHPGSKKTGAWVFAPLHLFSVTRKDEE